MKEPDPPGTGEQQAQCVIRHFAHAIVRTVRHRNSQRRSRRDVDVIDADPKPSDRLASATRTNHRIRDLGPVRRNGIDIRGGGDEGRFVRRGRFHNIGLNRRQNFALDGGVRPGSIRDQDSKARGHGRHPAARVSVSITPPGVGYLLLACSAASSAMRCAGTTKRSQLLSM